MSRDTLCPFGSGLGRANRAESCTAAGLTARPAETGPPTLQGGPRGQSRGQRSTGGFPTTEMRSKAKVAGTQGSRSGDPGEECAREEKEGGAGAIA